MKRSGAATPKRRASASAPKKSGPPKDIDDYLARLPEPARSVLQKLRNTIRAAAPKATESISYQVAAFRHLGMLVGFGASPKHCAFYVMSGTVLEPFEEELGAYDTSKGTIRFSAAAPLPAALVRKIVKARIAENEQSATRKGKGARSASVPSRARGGRARTRDV